MKMTPEATPCAPEAGDILIRDVADGDMAAIQDIYAHHVLEGLASFEEEPPDEAEMTHRRDALLAESYPYRVAVLDGRVKGYAYVSSFRPRPAYRHTVENSVYVDIGTQRRGDRPVLAERPDRTLHGAWVPPDDRRHRRFRQ